jgi:hypothetical protein
MAEQSIGMETGTGTPYGDGNVGTGYASTRMVAMETKTLSDGVLQTGSLLTMTGNGTNTLSIAAGAAIVGGYFYENTSSASIVITSLANATYNVAILVNSTTGTLTVSRSVSGTNVLAKTVRLVVATDAMVTAWISAGYSYLIMGTVAVNSALITASGITPNYAMYGTTTQLPYQAYATMGGGIATLTTANVQYDLSSFTTPTSSSDGLIVADNINNTMTVKRAGLYLITAFCVFGSGTTGSRVVAINVNGTNVSSTRAASSGSATHAMTQTAIHVLAANDVIKIGLISSLAAQSVTSGLFTVSRA